MLNSIHFLHIVPEFSNYSYIVEQKLKIINFPKEKDKEFKPGLNLAELVRFEFEPSFYWNFYIFFNLLLCILQKNIYDFILFDLI